MTNKYIEPLGVLFGASLTSLIVLAGFLWKGTIVGHIGTALFSFFLPGVWVAMQVSGGPEGSSEVNVFFGVFLQLVVLYVIGRQIYMFMKKRQ